jgi:hypothetical protein
VVLPEFLPFLMMSDRFMNRAVEISVGSLSPTINWSTLKLEEFAIPPLDQQRHISEILWAMDDVTQAQLTMRSNLDTYLKAFRASFLGVSRDNAHSAGDFQSQHRLMQIRDIGAKTRQAVQVGPFGGSLSSRYFMPAGVPLVKINNITADNKQYLQSSRQNSRPSQQINRSFLSLGSKPFRLKLSRCC